MKARKREEIPIPIIMDSTKTNINGYKKIGFYDKVIEALKCSCGYSLLQLLIEELMDFCLDVIEYSEEKTKNKLYSYALEIAVQIALCENNSKAWDLYYSGYSHPITFDVIKDWAAKKNYFLLRHILPRCLS